MNNLPGHEDSISAMLPHEESLLDNISTQPGLSAFQPAAESGAAPELVRCNHEWNPQAREEEWQALEGDEEIDESW
jgi:hypothetical protein